MNKIKTPLDFIEQAAELQKRKSKDYQNPNSRVRQADYYPRGIATILDIIHAKALRMRSVAEAMENDPDYDPNFESLEDSCLDMINYSAFLGAYLNGGIDGQDPDNDFLNRKKK